MRFLGPAICCAAILANGSGFASHERLVRNVQSPDGLPIAPVGRVAQDANGFLWVGSVAGLVRYDGVEMRRWASETLHGEIYVLETGPDGAIVAADVSTRTLYDVVPSGATPTPGPDGAPIDDVVDVAFGRDGRFWVARSGGELLERAADGAWTRWDPARLEGERISLVERGVDDGVLVAGEHVWRIAPTGAAHRLVKLRVTGLLAGDGNRFDAVDFDGDVWEFDGRDLHRLFEGRSRGIDLVRRDDTIWVGCAEQIVALRAGQMPVVIGAAQGIRDGGPLLVDREGSLWAGTFNGLLQFPEPDTRVWTERTGLPSTHTRWIAQTDEGLWITSWYGLTLIDPAERTAKKQPFHATQHLCVDNGGALWVYGKVFHGSDQRLARREGADFREFPDDRVPGNKRFRCAAAADGAVWFTVDRQLYRMEGDGPPEPAAAVPFEHDAVRSVVEDRTGRVWTAAGETICSAAADGLRGGGEAPWHCETVPGAGYIHELLPLDDGTILLATQGAAILERDGSRWRPVIDPASLASRRAGGVAVSPRGGVWFLIAGGIVRVEHRDGRWEVVESLDGWNGVPPASPTDLFEDDDGTIWLTSWAGVVQVPPTARRRPRSPPALALIDVRADGSRLTRTKPIELPFHRNRLELHFAALSYRDPALVRYRVRLRPDAPWSDSERPVFRYVDLSPGAYAAEVVASLDGETWSSEPVTVSFTVLRPWYQQPWAIASFALAVAAALYAVYRARLAYLVGLERQRTRIAMDLHDELGSGLGSIGLLSSISADRAFEGDPRKVAEEVSRTASELGGALSDIVWSLRGQSGKLEALAAHLAERGGRLFPGDRPRLAVEFPGSWPRVDVSLSVRRNVQLIALEAMHNAARHARASQVRLGLELIGRRVKLWIEDDGVGLPDGILEANATGLGLGNMRRRAQAIGAQIAWLAPARGTRVELVFDPHAEDRRSGAR